MNVRIVSRAEILSLVSMHDAIDAMARAFGQLSAGQVEMPVRVALASGGGISLFMPARLGASGERGAKVVSLFAGNRARGLPSINGVILMIDDETGLPLALMDAGELTALRTAAAAGLAARLLSRPDSRVLAVFGAGVQAPRQIEAIRAVRPIEEVRVVSRGGESARRLASSLEGVDARAVADPGAAVDGADIIVAVTTSETPVFDGTRLPAGTYVSGSGSFMPHMREIGGEVVVRARVVVEEREAALEEAGDLVIPIREGLVTADVIDADLGEIVNGDAPEGSAGRELTFFKSVGTAVQDVAIGAEVLRRAEAEGAGRVVGV
ncbi:MAG: ornithine cyclodeaminase family protein [Gemmatimonadota bacterium]|nr:ornithine cyclodeaminase family protein [Gemmatimonadota bacterium]MDE2873340.1 ornithine cyclodeaminase family protein [Gemmatimonadota bacterium]